MARRFSARKKAPWLRRNHWPTFVTAKRCSVLPTILIPVLITSKLRHGRRDSGQAAKNQFARARPFLERSAQLIARKNSREGRDVATCTKKPKEDRSGPKIGTFRKQPDPPPFVSNLDDPLESRPLPPQLDGVAVDWFRCRIDSFKGADRLYSRVLRAAYSSDKQQAQKQRRTPVHDGHKPFRHRTSDVGWLEFGADAMRFRGRASAPC
jgi:hypothetical protein